MNLKGDKAIQMVIDADLAWLNRGLVDTRIAFAQEEALNTGQPMPHPHPHSHITIAKSTAPLMVVPRYIGEFSGFHNFETAGSVSYSDETQHVSLGVQQISQSDLS